MNMYMGENLKTYRQTIRIRNEFNKITSASLHVNTYMYIHTVFLCSQ